MPEEIRHPTTADDVGAYRPLEDYAFLSDCHSWALVARNGAIDWFCVDTDRPMASRLLDHRRGGTLRVAPTRQAGVARRYLPDTNVLETTFRTSEGVLELTDALTVSGEHAAADRRIEVEPYDQLLRRMHCAAGSVEIEVEVAPRFDYGLTVPHVRLDGEHAARVFGGADALVVGGDVPLEQHHWSSCHARFRLDAGETRWLSLLPRPPHLLDARHDHGDLDARLTQTCRYWRSFAGRCRYDGPYRDAVVRSALVLKGLTHASTGAVVAAATTSLPESIGGDRNWDYRFSWVRDSAVHLEALFRLGYTDEAHAYMRWLVRTTAGNGDDLQIMYGPRGERLLPELVLDGLEGYRGSRPVRIGNAAVGQHQLDVYGQLLNAAWRYVRHGGEVLPEFGHLLHGVVRAVEDRWTAPDAGIWEVRSPPAQFTTSKTYAWIALDRALRLSDELEVDVDAPRLEGVRSLVRDRILRHGTRDDGALVRTFDDQDADASTLLAVVEGFLDGDGDRASATIDHVAGELQRDDLIHRYRTHDGFPAPEGAFVVCSFWMVSALALNGRREAAVELFEAMLSRANDVGILGEEIDPDSGAFLGNLPQALSHAGLVEAAWHLTGDRERAEEVREQDRDGVG